MEHGSPVQGKTEAVGICMLLCQGHHLLVPRQPLVRIAQRPQSQSTDVVAGYPLRTMRMCSGDRPQPEPCRSDGKVRRQEHGGILALLCQGQELLAQGVCRLHLGAYEM